MAVRIPVTAHGVSAELEFAERADHIARVVSGTHSFYERDLLDAIRAMGLVGTYVDAGAHVGNHSLFFALLCPSTAVLALEADPVTFRMLQKNATQSPKIDPRNVAVTSSECRAGICRPDPRNTGMNYVVAELAGEIRGAALDDLVDEDEPVVLIKLDVEGGELAAIRGAHRIVEQRRPVLAVESRSVEEDRVIAGLLEGELGYRRGRRYCATPTCLWHPRELW